MELDEARQFLVHAESVGVNTFGREEQPTFPFTITIDDGVTVTLLADGKWEGDISLVKKAMSEMKGKHGTGTVLMWLILRQMIRDDERFW